MNTCPIAGCSGKMEKTQLVCSVHWRKMPPPLRLRCQRVFNSYLDEQITMTQFRESGQAILAEWDSDEVPAGQLVRFTVCPTCGREVVSAVTSSDGLPVKVEGRADGPLCVFGGVVVSAGNLGPQYARFVAHKCKVATAAREQ